MLMWLKLTTSTGGRLLLIYLNRSLCCSCLITWASYLTLLDSIESDVSIGSLEW